MDTVTYPSPEVADLLSKRFVSYAINEASPSRADRAVIRRHRVLWSPAFVVLEPRGSEIRRVIGYRPPQEFAAELWVALGLIDLLYREFDSATENFDRAASLARQGEPGTEALFWRAIARFRDSGRDYDVLRSEWEDLRDRDPTGSWWARADVWDAVPTGKRDRSTGPDLKPGS